MNLLTDTPVRTEHFIAPPIALIDEHIRTLDPSHRESENSRWSAFRRTGINKGNMRRQNACLAQHGSLIPPDVFWKDFGFALTIKILREVTVV